MVAAAFESWMLFLWVVSLLSNTLLINKGVSGAYLCNDKMNILTPAFLLISTPLYFVAAFEVDEHADPRAAVQVARELAAGVERLALRRDFFRCTIEDLFQRQIERLFDNLRFGCRVTTSSPECSAWSSSSRRSCSSSTT